MLLLLKAHIFSGSPGKVLGNTAVVILGLKKSAFGNYTKKKTLFWHKDFIKPCFTISNSPEILWDGVTQSILDIHHAFVM